MNYYGDLAYSTNGYLGNSNLYGSYNSTMANGLSSAIYPSGQIAGSTTTHGTNILSTAAGESNPIPLSMQQLKLGATATNEDKTTPQGIVKPVALPATVVPPGQMANGTECVTTSPAGSRGIASATSPLPTALPCVTSTLPPSVAACTLAAASLQQTKRGRSEKKPVPEEQKDSKYYERRRRNNEAAKKSRDQRKDREQSIAIKAGILEQENQMLRVQLQMLRDEQLRLQELVVQRKQHQHVFSYTGLSCK